MCKLPHLPPLTPRLDNVDNFVVPDAIQEVLRPNETEPSATGRSKSKLKSLTSSTAKLLLYGVKESSDAFPPLKSVAGGLCFIMDNCEV